MPLSAPTGPYLVSTLDVEVPVRQPRTFSAAQFRLPGAGGKSQPALKLQTVLLTIYYPYALAADQRDKARSASAKTGTVGWLGAERLKVLEGLLKYAGISKYLALPVVLPAYGAFFAKLPLARDQPLLAPPTSSTSSSASSPAPASAAPRWPTAVFSHGLGGTRTTYSQYCASLASHGTVVAAVEHRDRTAPYTLVSRVDTPSSASAGAKAKPDVHTEQLVYTKIDELQPGDASADGLPDEEVEAAPAARGTDDSSSSNGGGDAAAAAKAAKDAAAYRWRRAQLALRRAEVLEALDVLQRINGAGAGADGSSAAEAVERLLAQSAPCVLRGEGRGARLAETWAGKLELAAGAPAAEREQPPQTLIGHSFGGATAIDLVLRSESHAAPCPFGRVVLLDPWLEPLQARNAGPLDESSSLARETYVMNSEAFTIWRPHMELLRSVVQRTRDRMGGKSWLLTLSGTKHTDFSDFPFLLARMFSSKVEPNRAIRFFADWTLSVLPGVTGTQKGSATAASTDVEMRAEKPGEVEARDLGEPKGVGIWSVPKDSVPAAQNGAASRAAL